MRKAYIILIGSILLVVATVMIYSVFTNYKKDPELANFPIPTNATLDVKTDYTKHFHWKGTSGTELQFTYTLAIKRAGWEEVPVDGQMAQYKKDGATVTVIPSTDYLEISLEQ